MYFVPKLRPGCCMARKELVVPSGKPLCCAGAGGGGEGLYRRSAQMWPEIHSAEARDLALAADLVLYERPAPCPSSSGPSSSLHGAARLAAALANSSAFSLLGIPLCAGTQRTATPVSRAMTRPQASLAAMAKRWPGHKAPVPTRLMAAAGPASG